VSRDARTNLQHAFLFTVDHGGQRTPWGYTRQETASQANGERDIYPANVDAKAEIAEALANAAKTHRRVILVFGGNWCYDCHVLDAAFHSP
jgi:thiol:disulfide interchange protein